MTGSEQSSAEIAAVGQALAKALARFADFAVDVCESFHRDLGLEVPKRSGTGAPTAGVLGSKRKRQAVDPKAPKKPKSAYMLFGEWAREQAKQKGETAPAMTKLGEEWQAMSEADKARFVEEADKLKDTYTKELEKYKSENLDGEDVMSNAGDVPPP
jgi:hypothetical protein